MMEVQDLIMRALLFTCAVYIVSIEMKYVLELDDVTAAVNKKFVYTIGDQKFAQTYRIHRIVDRKTKSLPDWLSFDNATNILYGTPTSEDIGTYSIRMKATCIDPPNMECQEKISRSFQIRIVEPIKSADSRGRDNYRLHAWSEKHHGKYSLNLTSSLVTSASFVDFKNNLMHDVFDLLEYPTAHTPFQTYSKVSSSAYSLINSEIVNFCVNGSPAFYASLILHVKHESSASILYSNMVSFSDFVSKPIQLFSLTNSSYDILSMQMNNKHIITAGPGNVVASLKESLELSWHVSCGEFLHVEEFGKVLQHNIDVGRITKELGTDVIAWYLYSDQPVSHRRKRQANSRLKGTKTPTFSLFPSTTIIDVSSIIFTGLQTSESKISVSATSAVFPMSTLFETSRSSLSSRRSDISSLFDLESSLFPFSSIFDSLVSFSVNSLSFPGSSTKFSDVIFPTPFSSEKVLYSSSSIKTDSTSSLSSFGLEVDYTSSFSPTITLSSSFGIESDSTEMFTDLVDLSYSIAFSSTDQLITSEIISLIASSSVLNKSSASVEVSTILTEATGLSISVVDKTSLITNSSLFAFSFSATQSSFLSLNSVFEESSLPALFSIELTVITSMSKFMSPSLIFAPFPSSSIFTAVGTKQEASQSQINSEFFTDSTGISELLTSFQMLSLSLFMESYRSTQSSSSFDIFSSASSPSSTISDLTSPDSFSIIEGSTLSELFSDFSPLSTFPSFLTSQISLTVSSQTEMKDFSLSSMEVASKTFSFPFSLTELIVTSYFSSEIFETTFDSISPIGSSFLEYDSLLSSTAHDASLFTTIQSSELVETTALSQLHPTFNNLSTFSTADLRMNSAPSVASFESVRPVKTSFISQSTDNSALQSTEKSLFGLSSTVFPETISKLDTSLTNTVLSHNTLTTTSPSIPSMGSSDTILYSSLDFSNTVSEALISTEILIATKTTRPLFSTEAEIFETPSSLNSSFTGMTITSTIKGTPFSSNVLMSSSPGLLPVPVDDPPFRQNSIDHLTIVFDKFFTYTIPANTFNDTEDGNTRNLTLSISLLYGKPIPVGAWLKFNSTSQTLYGIPLQQDIKNEDRFVERFVLIATDSQGQTTRDVISLSYSIEVLAITHSISLELDVDFNEFHLERQNLVDVAENLALLYGNPNLKYMTFFDVRKGSAIVRWGNNSLFGSVCYKDIIQDVFSRVAFKNGTLTAELEDLLSNFNPVSAKLDLTGPCLLPQLTPLPPFDSPVGASDNDRMWIEILLPALVVILILVIIALVLLICCRHRKPSKEPQSDKPTFLEDRRPIIFPEELEMVDPSLKPKQPLILPRDYLTETPPAVPPHGLQDPPSYRVPEINEDIFRPGGSQTPPPPSYGNQSTSEPPPYRLPPPYYNPHRANIKT